MAKTLIYEQSQHTTFPETVKRLTNNKALDNKDDLLPYLPFMDDNLTRARGRLRYSQMPDASKYPINLTKGALDTTYDQKRSS